MRTESVTESGLSIRPVVRHCLAANDLRQRARQLIWIKAEHDLSSFLGDGNDFYQKTVDAYGDSVVVVSAHPVDKIVAQHY